MPKHIIYHRHFQISTALIVTDALVFSLVNPISASAPWLITGYLLLAATFFSLAALVAQSLRTYGDHTYKVAWRLIRYSVFAVVILIGLQSIGQLTTRDIVTFTPFVAIAYWYFGYSKRQAPQLVSNK